MENYLILAGITAIHFNPVSFGVIAGIIIIIVLLFMSALMSGSEVAFFSLTPSDIYNFKKNKHRKDQQIVKLLDMPERLLATLLIMNNLVNIGMVIVSAFVANTLIDFSESPVYGFIFQIVIITFLLLLFGEVLPKVYATRFAKSFALFMAFPITFIIRLMYPFSSFLMLSSTFVKKRMMKKKLNLSMDELSEALELTSGQIPEEKEMLEGIIKFRNVEVKEIMKPRVDVIAVEIKIRLSKLISVIIENGYSRIPVYSKTFDNVKGILYAKDLLPHHHKDNSFSWQSLIRPPYFVPENKKINELLDEFQSKKIHMAIVIDEYGGSSGIITLEDILEEIIGEIHDEFDDPEKTFSRISENIYLFEGRTMIKDFCRITGMEDSIFDDVRGDADTLAGLVLEKKGKIPDKHEDIQVKNFSFRIESVDSRRIKQIRVVIPVTKEKKE